MVTLKRIGVSSAGRVGFFFSLITTLVHFSVWLFTLIVIEGVPISVIPAELWRQIAINILINCLVSGVAFACFALVYNWMPNTGLQLEFEVHPTSTEKRKNDDADIEEID
ncbi:MAG: hypothetical protein WBC91_09920 [Phototrophicaceae bacterium]